MLQKIAKKIKSTRKARGMTLFELSAATKINTADLSRIENGKRNITVEKLAVILQVLKLKITIK